MAEWANYVNKKYMKYTKKLINGNFIDLTTHNLVQEMIHPILAIFLGIGLCSILPITITYDSFNYLKNKI